MIHPRATAVLVSFQEAGFEAYVTGGCVRDLALRRLPRDVDIGTTASSRDIDAVLGTGTAQQDRGATSALAGADTLEIDVLPMGMPPWVPRKRWRRRQTSGSVGQDFAESFDFTVNALLYNPLADTVFDHVGGIRDLRLRQLRRVGDRGEMFGVDPISILRGVTIASKLALTIEAATYRAMGEHTDQLATAHPGRLSAHLIKLLTCGASVSALAKLREMGAIAVLFPPPVAESLADEALTSKWASALDRTQRQGLPLSVVLALLLFHPAGPRPNSVGALVSALAERFAMPKRVWVDVALILGEVLDPQRPSRPGRSPAEHRRSAAARQLLQLIAG